MSSIIVRSARIAMPLGNIANLRVSVDRSLATAGGPAAGVVATAAVTAQGVSIILPQITLYTTWDAPDATTQQAQYTAELVDSLGRVLVRFDGLNPFQLRLANTQTTWKEIQDWNEFYRQSKFLTPNEVPGQYDTEPLQLPGNNIFLGQQSNSATDTMGIYAGNTDNPPGLRFNVATQVWEYSTDGTTWMAIGSGGGGGGSPAGPVNAVQFNNAGSFGGSADFAYNSMTNSLSLGSSVTPGGFRLVGLTGNYWNLASQNPAGNRTFYFPDDVTPDTGNFLFVSNFGSTVQTDWSTGATWSNSTRTLTLLGQLNTQLGLNLSNTSNQAAAQTVAAFTNDASESAFLSLTGSGFTPAGLQTASQLYLKGFAGVDQMAFELVETAGIFRWGFNGTERVRLDNTTGITITSPGGANTSGLKLANLTSASPAGASTAYLGVDGSGNVVRAAAPGGGGAPADATYLTLTLNGTLTNERVFTLADTTLSEVDGGAGGAYTLGVNQANAFAWTGVHTWTPSTSQVNAISLLKTSLGAAGQRDSDRFLIQAKANDGTSYAIETRNYINVISNDGVGSLWTVDGRNTFAGAGFNTLLTLNISSGDLSASGALSSGIASTATGGLILFNNGGTTSTTLQAGNAASSLTYILPITSPLAGQVLTAAAPSGSIVNTSWQTASGGVTNNGTEKSTSAGTDALASQTTGIVSNGGNTAFGYEAANALTTSVFGSFYGYQAGKFNTGSENTFLGYQAGAGSVGTSTGEDNTFIGAFAGKANTTGDIGVFLGPYSGFSNTTGDQNILVGFNAGRAITTSNYNLGIGPNTIKSATTVGVGGVLGTGGYLFGMGHNALENNTTGYANYAWGHYAGQLNTTGNSNFWIGYNTGAQNTTGNENTGLGHETLELNQTGSFNTAAGSMAMRGTEPGGNVLYSASGNAAYGYMSGYNTRTGADGNTFVGFGAGYNNLTGAYNIAIGANVGLPSTSGSNQLNLANVLYGTNIYGDITVSGGAYPVNSASPATSARLGIGITSPAAVLDIALAAAASKPMLLLSGTWFDSGSATTTKPQLLVEPNGTTSTGWSTSGTGLGVNSYNGFTGNLIDLQVGASRKFSVTGDGRMGLGRTPTAGILTDLFSSTISAGFLIETSLATGYSYTTYKNPGGECYIGKERASGGGLLPGDSGNAFIISTGNANPIQFGTNNSLKLTLASDGRLYGTALHNNAGAVTGTTNQYIASGTYTPTITAVANCTVNSATLSSWMRVGNVVTVTVQLNIDPTLTATTTQVRVSLPIASNFAGGNQCGGTAYCPGIASLGAAILADVANDEALIQFVSTDVTDQLWAGSFTYLIS